VVGGGGEGGCVEWVYVAVDSVLGSEPNLSINDQ
jgi:hypothetical protein